MKLECLERGHWYLRPVDGALFIVGDDRYGLSDTYGPDDDSLDALNAAYRGLDQSRKDWFDLVDCEAIAVGLGLESVPDWQKRYEPVGDCYYVA